MGFGFNPTSYIKTTILMTSTPIILLYIGVDDDMSIGELVFYIWLVGFNIMPLIIFKFYQYGISEQTFIKILIFAYIIEYVLLPIIVLYYDPLEPDHNIKSAQDPRLFFRLVLSGTFTTHTLRIMEMIAYKFEFYKKYGIKTSLQAIMQWNGHNTTFYHPDETIFKVQSKFLAHYVDKNLTGIKRGFVMLLHTIGDLACLHVLSFVMEKYEPVVNENYVLRTYLNGLFIAIQMQYFINRINWLFQMIFNSNVYIISSAQNAFLSLNILDFWRRQTTHQRYSLHNVVFLPIVKKTSNYYLASFGVFFANLILHLILTRTLMGYFAFARWCVLFGWMFALTMIDYTIAKTFKNKTKSEDKSSSNKYPFYIKIIRFFLCQFALFITADIISPKLLPFGIDSYTHYRQNIL